MTYTPTSWSDEVPASSPVKYNIKTSGGTPIYTDVQIEVNTSVTPGTPLNASNLNHIETGIQTLENASPPKVFTAKGDLFVGSAAGAGVIKTVGSNYQTLLANSGQAGGIQWVDGVPGIFQSRGDMCVGYAADTSVRLAVGADHGHLVADYSRTQGMKWVDQITAQYERSAATQSLTDNTLTKVSFDTVVHDPYSCLSSGKFTAPVAGVYNVQAAAMFCQNPAQYGIHCRTLIAIYKNGTIWASKQVIHYATEASYPGSSADIAMLMDLAVSDYIEIYVRAYNGQTGWFLLNNTTPKTTWLDVFLVRA